MIGRSRIVEPFVCTSCDSDQAVLSVHCRRGRGFCAAPESVAVLHYCCRCCCCAAAGVYCKVYYTQYCVEAATMQDDSSVA